MQAGSPYWPTQRASPLPFRNLSDCCISAAPCPAHHAVQPQMDCCVGLGWVHSCLVEIVTGNLRRVCRRGQQFHIVYSLTAHARQLTCSRWLEDRKSSLQRKRHARGSCMLSRWSRCTHCASAPSGVHFQRTPPSRACPLLEPTLLAP